jgi:diguanylate cyclase (GGDEF)-like protein
VDLDRFKVVNDTLGHAVGDELLRQFARRLESMVRETDVVARWGGDEFVVGLLDMANPEDADRVAQKLIDGLSFPFEVDGHVLTQTATIGLSTYPKDGEDLTSLLRNADRALYRGKQRGRNTVQRSPGEAGKQDEGQLGLEVELRSALARGELTLHYQPEFDAYSGNLVGAEALLRWFHPRLGMIPPVQFIPIAEESGLIVPIGAWVLEQACRQLAAWQRDGCNVGTVAVNVSVLQFSCPNFVDTISAILTQTGLCPRTLELELTESILMRDIDASTRCTARLKDLGVKVTLDDFGTGYSSLGYLQRLPIENLKLDQLLIRDIGRSRNSELVVSSIVALAQNLGIHTTAEGIETEEQLRVIRTTRCDRVQGYLLSKPIPAPELSALESEYQVAARERFFATPLLPRRDSGIGQHAPLGDLGLVAMRIDSNLRVAHAETLGLTCV